MTSAVSSTVLFAILVGACYVDALLPPAPIPLLRRLPSHSLRADAHQAPKPIAAREVGGVGAWLPQSHLIAQAKRTTSAVLLATLLALPTLAQSLPAYAAYQNADAIDIRRVDEQPAVAPAPATALSKAVTQTLPNGVQYFDVSVGQGTPAEPGRSVQFQWVMRRQNGYFIDASSNYGDEPFIYKVGNTAKAIEGLDAGLRGMQAGGVRRIVVPASLAYTKGVDDSSPGPVPAGFGPRRQLLNIMNGKQTVYFEIKLTKVK